MADANRCPDRKQHCLSKLPAVQNEKSTGHDVPDMNYLIIGCRPAEARKLYTDG
jgi:hypothetical protein